MLSNIEKNKNICFIVSHPIQYIVPLYKSIADTNNNVHVFFCGNHGIEPSYDKQFGVKFKWDIPLLDGYKYTLLDKTKKKRIDKGFWGLLNFNIFCILLKMPKSLLIVSGWSYASYIIAIVFGKLFGHTVALRCENPLLKEHLLKPKKRLLKKISLTLFFKLFIDKFFYIGEQNKDFYLFYGVKESALYFTPYSVDNTLFQKEYTRLHPQKNELRQNKKIWINTKVFLFTGKYISVKQPLKILEAFNIANISNSLLIMVGEGELRKEMESYICENSLTDKVILTGFVNQSEIKEYYAIADYFVMFSETETWGLSVNEAMNFKLPVIVSHTMGCADDLVLQGKNGFICEQGNINQMANYMNKLTNLTDSELNLMQNLSIEIINKYTIDLSTKSIVYLAK